MKIMLQELFLFFLPSLLFFIVYFYSKKPTNKKDWKEEVKIQPHISIKGQNISIKNLRDFQYKTEQDFEKRYYSKSFKLSDIQSLDFLVEPFMKWRGISHTLVSFGLKDGSYISISVEVRKTRNQTFSFIKTFLRQYEVTYVLGSEEDLIKLRTKIRKDPVYLFPINADKNFIQQLFLDMIKRAKKLQKKPEFYHPWFNSCTTNLIDHANKIVKKNIIKKGIKTFFPGYTMDLIFDLHYVFNGEKHTKDFVYYKINDKALKSNKNFSKHIRTQ